MSLNLYTILVLAVDPSCSVGSRAALSLDQLFWGIPQISTRMRYGESAPRDLCHIPWVVFEQFLRSSGVHCLAKRDDYHRVWVCPKTMFWWVVHVKVRATGVPTRKVLRQSISVQQDDCRYWLHQSVVPVYTPVYSVIKNNSTYKFALWGLMITTSSHDSGYPLSISTSCSLM